MVSIIEKFKNKNSFEKLVRLFVNEIEQMERLWNVGTPS